MSAQSDKLLSDMKILLSDTEELVRATAAQTGDRVTDIRSRLQQAINNLKPQLARIETTMLEKSKATAAATDQYIHENPWLAVGVSAGLGVVIGLLIGRR
jgi:ElaB/YqjD/DUF883 family membrane-anchored ribosome-binding protein